MTKPGQRTALRLTVDSDVRDRTHGESWLVEPGSLGRIVTNPDDARAVTFEALAAGRGTISVHAFCRPQTSPQLVAEIPVSVEAEAAPTAGQDIGFGPLDRSCRTDEECDVIHAPYLSKDGLRCCTGCTPRAGRRGALEREQRACKQLSHEGCPMKKCAAIGKAACVKGTCMAPMPASGNDRLR